MQTAEVPSGGGFGGNLLGISVPSLLQMIESEQKSCTLRIRVGKTKAILPPLSRITILWKSILSFLALPPCLAFI